MPLEEMSSFFTARIDVYEAHMLHEGHNIYAEVAKLVPTKSNLKLLDLGCGTGLELDEIFKVNPSVRVTGIDLTQKMMDKLKEKHADKQNRLTLVCADYLKHDFGQNKFDVVMSVQTLHHFMSEEKIGLYKRIRAALTPSGFYIESDYMAPTQEFEDSHLAENKRLRAEQGIKEGYFHYDIPYTVEHQVGMLKKAGFGDVKIVSRAEKGAILIARK